MRLGPQILLGVWREYGAVLKLVSVYPNRGASPHTARYPEQKPNVNLQRSCSFDPHLCGQPEEDRLDLGEMQQPQVCVYTDARRAQERRAGNQLYGWMVLVAEIAQCGYDVLSSFAGHLLNWSARFRNYLQNIALRFPVFQPKSLPFRSPIIGL